MLALMMKWWYEHDYINDVKCLNLYFVACLHNVEYVSNMPSNIINRNLAWLFREAIYVVLMWRINNILNKKGNTLNEA